MNINSLTRVSKVIQTEATTSSIGDFLLTHIPFENLYTDPGSRKAITEKQLLDNVLLDNQDEHKFILVQGGNGSGKSHLIRWLKEKYVHSVDSDKEAVLLISRAHNTLQDALTQLLESDIFPQEVRENELKHIKNAKSNITGEELNKTINFNFTLEIDADENKKVELLDLKTRRWLSTYLTDKYIQSEFLLKSNGPIERIRGKIENISEDSVNLSDSPMFIPDDFKISTQQITSNLKTSDARAAEFTIRLAETFNSARKGEELREKVANYLNTKVSDVIQRSMKLQTADFKKLFAALRKTLKEQGVNLTLFIEDINSFTGIDEALMEVLLTDHSAEGNENYCRIISVVGSTSAFYNNKLNASIKERIKSNIYISENSILGTKSKVAKFAAKYINAINLSQEEVDEWERNGANDNEFPIHKEKWEWANLDCDGNVLSIFPFNENALWNLYSELDNDKKTPRVFLKSIIAHILKIWYTKQKWLFSDEANFLNADVINFPRWANLLFNKTNIGIDEESATERGILLRVWGDKTANNTPGELGGLTVDVFEAFDIYNNISGEAPRNKEKSNLNNEVNRGNISVTTAVNNQDKIVDTPVIKQIKIQKSKTLVDIETDLNEWMYATDASKGRLRNYIELRKLLTDFLDSAINWEVEEVPEILVSSYLITKRVHIEGAKKESDDGFILKKNESSYYLLLALASFKHLGSDTWDFEGAEDHLINATAWLENNKHDVIKSIISPEGHSDIWNLPLWSIASVYCIKTLFGGVDVNKSSEEIIIDLLGTSPNYNEQTIHSDTWDELQRMVLKEDNYKSKIIHSTKAYFSKSIGGAEAGTTNYTFVDALTIIKLVKEMKKIQWNIEELVIEEIPNYSSVWYYAPNFLKNFSSKVGVAINEEKVKATEYMNLFSNIFENDFDEANINSSINEMKDFLSFLTGTLNLSYSEEDFKMIKSPATASTRLSAAINRTSKVLDEATPYEILQKISKNPFEEIEKFKLCFIQFNRLLEEKNQNFSAHVDLESKEAIEQYNKEIIVALENIIEELDGLVHIGGIVNEK